ncbi:DMT family transporter [Patescibacteria group bacterium]
MKIKLQHAIGLALATAVISGVATFVAKKAVTVVSDPVVFTLLKNAIVAMLLIGLAVVFTKFKELKGLRKKDWTKLIAIGVVGGSIPFILFFTGLTMTTAVSAGMIHKTLFIWVALLAVPFLKERVGWKQAAAFILLIGGSFALGGFKGFQFGIGELMVLVATLFWAVENIIAKKALANLSSLLVAGARMVFGSVILLAVVGFQGNLSLIGGLNAEQWIWTLIPALFLIGYVTTWYTALKHAPASLVASLLVPAALITNVLSLVFLDKALTVAEIGGSIFFIAAITLLVWGAKKTSLQQRYAEATSNNTT